MRLLTSLPWKLRRLLSNSGSMAQLMKGKESLEFVFNLLITLEQWFPNFLLMPFNKHKSLICLNSQIGISISFLNKIFRCPFMLCGYGNLPLWKAQGTDSPAVTPWVHWCLGIHIHPPPQGRPSQHLGCWGAGESSCLGGWGQLRPKDSPAACRNFPRTTLPVETASPTFLPSPSSCKDVRPTWRSRPTCLCFLPLSFSFVSTYLLPQPPNLFLV